MKIKNVDIGIDEAIKFSNHDNYFLNRRGNGLKLSDFQVNVLSRNGINYLNYSDYKNLLFEIEDILNSNYDYELDIVSSQISEYIYYNFTNK